MLKLIQTDWGIFDLAFDDPAQGDAAAKAATVVYAVLNTDAQAPADRVDDPFDRRGWFDTPDAGTGLWYVRRQPLTDAARRETVDMVLIALKAEAPAIQDVAVNQVTATEPAGNVSSVFLEITGSHNGTKFLVRAPL